MISPISAGQTLGFSTLRQIYIFLKFSLAKSHESIVLNIGRAASAFPSMTFVQELYFLCIMYPVHRSYFC